MESEAADASSPQLGLFGFSSPADESKSDPIRDMLDDIDPDDLSPRVALEWLYRLKYKQE